MSSNPIDNVLNTSNYHIFHNNKEIVPLSKKTIPGVKKAIKENVNPPKEDKKVFIVKLKYNSKSNKKMLIIKCSMMTITTDKTFIKDDNDYSYDIIYSADEYNKFNFSLDHIKQIINQLNKDKQDIDNKTMNISDILSDNVDSIDSVLSTGYYHIFNTNFEPINSLTQKTIPGIEKAIKENINPPTENKKVFTVRLKFNPKSDKQKLIINCSQMTITP